MCRMVTTLGGITKQFFKEATPFCISTNNIWRFWFVHKLATTLLFIFITVILVGVKWYPLMVLISISLIMGFPGDSVVKNPPANAGDTGLIPGPGRSPREGNSNPLKYSCLGNPMDRGVWQATIHGTHKKVRQNLVTKQQ